METTIFTAFITACVFAFLCCLQYRPAVPATPAAAPEAAKASAARLRSKASEARLRSKASAARLRSNNPPLPEAVPQAPPTAAPPLSNPDFNPSTLTLREARKVAKALGIRQKVNGKDQPKAWLIAQIQQAKERQKAKGKRQEAKGTLPAKVENKRRKHK